MQKSDARIFASAKIRRRSHKLPREGRNLCARNWRAPIPTLRANLPPRRGGATSEASSLVRVFPIYRKNADIKFLIPTGSVVRIGEQ